MWLRRLAAEMDGKHCGETPQPQRAKNGVESKLNQLTELALDPVTLHSIAGNHRLLLAMANFGSHASFFSANFSSTLSGLFSAHSLLSKLMVV